MGEYMGLSFIRVLHKHTQSVQNMRNIQSTQINFGLQQNKTKVQYTL